jgi:hypothetical protein
MAPRPNSALFSSEIGRSTTHADPTAFNPSQSWLISHQPSHFATFPQVLHGPEDLTFDKTTFAFGRLGIIDEEFQMPLHLNFS